MSPPHNTLTSYSIHRSISELVDRYDGFILDQFGVMHNGVSALTGAVDCVHRLCHDYNKRLVILSNSSSLSNATMERLPTLNFNASDFVGAVTSGQEASQFVHDNYASKTSERLVKALLFTWESPKSPRSFIEACGTNVQATDCVEEADFILLHGSQVLWGYDENGQVRETGLGFFDSGDLSQVEPILQQCKKRNLAMVCCNPDYVYVSPDGTIKHMPGTIADLYLNKFDGAVHSFGKPHVPHFEACVQLMGLPKERIVHVGDSLHHDVKGANDAGLASIFVANGVHRQELNMKVDDDLPDRTTLNELFEKHGHIPTHVVPLLQLQ